MSTVNPPGSGTNQPIPPSNEDAEQNNQNNNDENNQRPQTGVGERIKGMTLAERMKANKNGITTTNGGPSVRQTDAPPAEDGSDAENNNNN